MSESLYVRLGEEEGITKLVRDIVDLHMKNPLISKRYVKMKEDPAHMDLIRTHVTNFFCAGAGGPQSYGGKNMLDTHKGMNISEQEFIAVVDDAMEAMDMNKYADNEKKDVLAILYSLKAEIIRV